MKKELMEEVSCNLCDNKDEKIIYEAKYNLETKSDFDVKFKSSGDERLIDRVVECKKCGLRYVNPRLKPTLIIKGYSEGSDENFISQAEGRERTFRRQLNFINNYTVKGNLLDIGTAGGSFLKVAKEDGWSVEGIEPNKWLCEWGFKNYGIKIKQGVLKDYKFPSNNFDLITLWDVLEHTSDPRSVLKECCRILKPGGTILINYPDVDTIIHKLMGRRWIFYLSVHLYYFTPKTLTKMLENEGFKPLIFKNHWQTLELGYLLFRLHTYNKILSKIGCYLVKKLGISRLPIYYWLGQTLCIARKNE